jgi:hypothetical protein
LAAGKINSIEDFNRGLNCGRGGPDLPLFGGSNRPNWVSSNVRSSVDMGSFDPAKDSIPEH